MPDDTSPIEKFTGLSGFWGDLLKIGFAGVITAAFLWLLTIHVPGENARHVEEMRYERDRAREDAEKSRQHGTKVAKELADAIRENTRISDWNQALIQSNQEEQIRIQQKAIKKTP